MSNLGLYQTITTWSKKLHGPQNLIAVIFGAGAITASPIAFYIGKKSAERKQQLEKQIYVITTQGQSNEGIVFNIGDKFIILEKDNDVALIEKLDDTNNPYYVSYSWIKTISEKQ